MLLWLIDQLGVRTCALVALPGLISLMKWNSEHETNLSAESLVGVALMSMQCT